MDSLTKVRRNCRILLAHAALAGMLASPVASQEPDSGASSVQAVASVCTAEPQAFPSVGPSACSAIGQPFQGPTSRRWVGAGIGAVVGVAATYFVLNSGGSTSLCDKSANQDATSTGVCVGLYVLGGLAGAGLGWITVGLVTSDSDQGGPTRSLRIGLQFDLEH